MREILNYPLFSVVVPVYGCANSLKALHDQITGALTQVTNEYEIIFVDDASPDNAWAVIDEISHADDKIKAICLSRNFGQHPAIMAGLSHCNGAWVVVMDCDLQDFPQEILRLYEKAQEGYDIVLARRSQRQDSIFRRYGSFLFSKILKFLSNKKIDASIGNFGIYSRYVIESILKLKEQISSFPFMVRWVGFRVASIDVRHHQRHAGKSAYNLSKLIRFALINIIYQSDRPLVFIMETGILLSSLSFLYTVYSVFRYVIYDIKVEGWTSLIVSIHFLGGLLMLGIGIIGLYIAKIFDETRSRPLYIVEKKIGL